MAQREPATRPAAALLLSQHQALLEGSAINADVATARGYRSIGRAEARELGFTGAQARPGLLIPLWRVDGEPGGYQLRPNEPRLDREGRAIKYETPKGQANILDVPPPVRDKLHKGMQAILITEGAKKADALASLGIPCINISGVFGWRGRNHDSGLTVLPDWESVNIKGSIFVLAFDSDILTKVPVHQALSRVKLWLESKGAARVRVLVVPSLLSGKTGVDDYIAETNVTVEELAKLVVDTLPLMPAPPSTESPPSGPPPDLADLLDQVASTIRSYVVVTAEQGDAVALWTAHTHAFEAADATPYLAINSPEKRSGKTRLLETLKFLVARPWFTSRVSAAVLVRKTDKEQPTLLLDESDTAFKSGQEYAEALRGLLNAGHRRGGVISLCLDYGKNYHDFRVYSAKAIAGINKLPDTVADRAIPITLKRRAKNEPVRRFREREAKAEAEPVRLGLVAWAATAIPTLRDARPDLPDELDDRAMDAWEPLLAIADLADGTWPGRARKAALMLSGSREREDESLGVRLLNDIRQGFGAADRVATSTLIECLCAMDEAPWASLGRGHDKRITPTDLANLLKPYDVRPQGIRIGTLTPRGYLRASFQDAWLRYTPLSSATMQHQDNEAVEPVAPDISAQAQVQRLPADNDANVALLHLESQPSLDVSGVSGVLNPSRTVQRDRRPV